jgi:Xaa-Pro aminopeptidase
MKKRVKKVQKELAKQNLDALLVRVWEGDNQNVLYLSGFAGSTGILLITQDKAFIITDARYYTRAVEEAPAFKLVKHTRGRKTSEHINETLAECGLKKTTRVAFEANRTTVEVADNWKKELKATLVPTHHFVERFRQYKDEDEIKALRKACKATSKVFNEVVPLIKPGVTENEVAFELDMRLRRHGALTNSFSSIVASGPNSAVPHHQTGDRKLKAGEPVVLDFAGSFRVGIAPISQERCLCPAKIPMPKWSKFTTSCLRLTRRLAKRCVPASCIVSSIRLPETI